MQRKFLAKAIIVFGLIAGAIYVSFTLDKSQTTKLSFMNKIYEFPSNYQILRSDVKDNRSFSINAKYPDMKPLNSQEGDYKVRGWGNHVIILLIDPNQSVSTAQRLNNMCRRLSPLRSRGNQFGLQMFTAEGKAINPTTKPQGCVVETKSSKNAVATNEVYIDNTSNPSLMMICSEDREGYSPSCEMTFEENGISYQISFSKKFMGEWEKIRKSSVALIRSFEK
ncbi:MAG: hypothetical protein DI585_05805 [Pseudomonas fluorescens]|nr:MAG: hypothetical protein DI585_05805 [Pseudomonas fluorescens]